MVKTGVVFAGLLCIAHGASAQESRSLDSFEDAAAWRVIASDQVSGSIRQVDGLQGKGLCLDYDFNGVSGYAGMQRDLPLQYPANYRFDFQLRGDSPDNGLQFKLIDASGDNVWWVNKPRYVYPRDWTPVRYKQRHIAKAWGPGVDPVLRNSAKLEFTVYNNAGGKGSVCFEELTFTPLASDDGAPLAIQATVSSAAADALKAVDADPSSAWRSGRGKAQRITFDLGRVREFGGLTLRWAGGDFASRYDTLLSGDGKRWNRVRRLSAGNGGIDWIALPESESRYLALELHDGPGGSYALADVKVQPLGFAATPNDFIKAVARDSPRGWYPRGFTGEQAYWTIVGVDGGAEQGLIGEDGAIEVAKGGFSIEPFVIVDGKLVSWADVQATQSLEDGYLPIPGVHWKRADFDLGVTAFAQGSKESSRIVAQYALTNKTKSQQQFVLALAARPLQVNPATQFLNTVGGFSPIKRISVQGWGMSLDGGRRVFSSEVPTGAIASSFDSGDVVERLSRSDWRAIPPGSNPNHPFAVANDPTGMVSGAMVYRATLAPGETWSVNIATPWRGNGGSTGRAPSQAGPDSGNAQRERMAAEWRDKLGRVRIDVPPQGRTLVDTLRTATAHMLISRVGPRLQPGTRSYARSWIRDGAMISEGLLRMGREDVVRRYIQWYAPYQFDNGKVPCCVDDRGSDPVPENDSQGELIFSIAEYYRYTGDRAFLEKMWPHVRGAFDYMETLRLSERTAANRDVNPAFYGMMPASISHEGYSAKPMHSYWDNFWALRGYKDAVDVAQWLGKPGDAERMAAARDQFRADLDASLRAAAKLHKIDYLPGAAELGDFDATSTTIALAPGGEQGRLPQDLLRNTFERYWREFQQRRDGKREWDAYTPYEWRNVGAFVRMGWRERAWEAVQFFFKDRAPEAWNQWAEVVSRTPRKPFFVGDLPHAWVASDFVRSALDMFAYTRETDDSIVLAAGVPVDWFDGDGIAIDGLRTPQGTLGYSLRRDGLRLQLEIADGLRLPTGGLVLPWPYAGKPGATTVNGKVVAWHDGELRIGTLPAKVEITLQERLQPPAALIGAGAMQVASFPARARQREAVEFRTRGSRVGKGSCRRNHSCPPTPLQAGCPLTGCR